MDGLKPGRGTYSHQPQERSSIRSGRSHSFQTQSKERHSGEKYWLVRSLGKVASKKRKTLWRKFQQTEFAKWPDKSIWHRTFAVFTLVLFIVSTLAATIQPFLDDKFYGVTEAVRSVLPEPNDNIAKYLKYNAKDKKFLLNEGYTGSTGLLSKAGQGEPRITASFAKEPRDGVTVTDPLNKIDFTIKPKFSLNTGKQDRNQIFYPLTKATGYLVYTSQIASVKEDIVIEKAPGDKLAFEYELGLGDGLEARLEKNGSIGIYGTSLPVTGNVSTGSEKDAELLQKARENAKKDKFLFGIPAPVVVETGKEQSSIRAYFKLEGNKLAVITEGLEGANYPLSIDPSVYVQSVAQLMRGNNESNVEFDVATEQFKKGTTTGARIDEWTQTGSMNDATYDQAVAAAGGYVYRAGGRSGQIIPYVADMKTTQIGTASQSTVLNMPDYRPAGYLYIAIIGFDNNANISSAPAGWTGITSNANGTRAYYHVGAASEPATYTWTTAANQQVSAVILRIANADISTAPIGTSRIGTAGQVPTYNGVTPTQNGSLIIGGASLQQVVPPSRGYAPVANTEITSLHSTGTGGSGTVGLVASSLDSPPFANVNAGAQATRLASASNAWGSVTVAIYGSSATSSYQSSVQWAHFNGTTGSIDSPAPGSNGTACTNWCTNSAYDLPQASSSSDGAGSIGAQMVAYNGYLYYVGGSDGTNLKDTVYIAKLGANGEPSLWHPSDPDQPDWVYWYKHTALSSARAYHSLYAYNGKMYILGGDTNLSSYNTGALDTVQIADILPNGTLGTWSSGQTLTGGARYGASVQGYNGYLYILGGNNNGTMLNLAQYSRLNADGTMNSWQTANVDGVSFSTGRSAQGGVMSGMWGGYIYVAGGCTAVNTSGNGYCTSIAPDVQLASINADGTLDAWNTMANVTHQRFGSSFIAWQDNLYRFGGCSSQDTGAATCYATHVDNQYGPINQDGDASTVSITSASGSGLCQGGDPYDCNLPPGGTGAGQAGQALTATAIMNGYLYVTGGCTTNACTTMTRNTAYVAIDSTGKLKSPPSCEGTKYGAWCVDSTNLLATGVGAAGTAVFGGYIYLVGGQTGSAGANTIQRNTVNSDGSLAGAWQSQSLSGTGATSVSYTFAYARANPGSAGTNPGNLYIFGGCSSPASGAGCTSGNNYTQNVFKCNIQTATTIASCSTSGQLNIGTVTGASDPGLGIHAGTVYANYIYLIGGVANGFADIPTVRYAKFDNNNNVVAASGGAWVESPVEMNKGRRRGTAFGYNGYLYAVGGYDSVTGSVLDTVEFVKVNISDGSLISSTPKSGSPGKYLFKQSAVTINQRWGLGIAVSNSYAYIIGGCKDGVSPTCNSGGLDDTVQTFQVYNNDSGAPGGYTTSANMFSTNRIGGSAAVLNGYMYIAGGCINNTDCTSVTTNVQKASIDANGALGAWTNTNVAALPAGRGYGELEVAGNTLYFLGGQLGNGTPQTTVFYATMGSNGEISSWGTASGGVGDTNSQGAVRRAQFGAAVWNNRIYITGGVDETATRSNHVYISPDLSAGGDIPSNSWTGGSGSGFNVAREGHTAITYANNLYILGGYTGSVYLSDVQFTKINSDGSLGSWTYSTNLPFGLRQADGFAVNGYLYLFGGRTSTNDCAPRTLVAPISANTTIASGNNPTGIGEWYQTNRNFDGGRYGVAAVYSQGKSYVLGGGCQGIVMQDDFDATLDAAEWSATPGMTVGTTCQSTSTSNVLYMTDGNSGNNYAATKDVNVSSGGTIFFKFYAPISDTAGCFRREQNLFSTADNIQLQYSTNGTWAAPTTITTYPWNTDYSPMRRISVTIPAGAQTTSTRFRWVMPGGAANDSFSLEDVYIVATGNTTVSYPPDRVAQTTLLSQPQIANYSRLIDAGRDVFPTKWLLNGLDNSIGARWQMSYRSMNDPTVTDTNKACGGSAMTGYGSLTNFGNVTLGNPETYTVKNGAGTDISCGRYFFMNISIDASFTYGYPDDISRGPTLDNLTLFFKSNPGQRLLHGKTFIEGTQQPLDTQPGP